MFGPHFYHQKVRKCVAAFGSLFTQLYILRKDSSGAVISTIRVPLAYAPRDKYIERIQGIQDIQRDEAVALKLPRMSFEITSYIYDDTRQLQKLNKTFHNNTISDEGSKKDVVTRSVPYNITFSLTIYAKAQDDALQVVEQILPFFSPQYTLTMKPFDDYTDLLEDIPITLQGVSYLSDFEGPLQDRSVLQYVLDFEMKTAFYGPIDAGKSVIQKSIVNYDLDQADSAGFAFSVEYTPKFFSRTPDDPLFPGYNTKYVGDSSL
jgi:hypothetical protein|tara:strand:+ start:4539 stop:5327 length:789 start_codon:yes stop_codon:yes gene_type:complete